LIKKNNSITAGQHVYTTSLSHLNVLKYVTIHHKPLIKYATDRFF